MVNTSSVRVRRGVNGIWVVQQGSVEFTDRTERVVDIRGPGDMLGLDGFATSEAYADSVRTAGDVILYALNAERVITIVRKYSEALRFVEAYLAVHGGQDVDPVHRSWFEEPGPPVAFARRRNVVAAIGAQVARPDLTRGEYLLALFGAGATTSKLPVMAKPPLLWKPFSQRRILRLALEGRHGFSALEEIVAS